MRRIDEQFTKRPFYGVPRMTASLRRMGYGVNPKRVRRLMRLMGLMAIYPRAVYDIRKVPRMIKLKWTKKSSKFPIKIVDWNRRENPVGYPAGRRHASNEPD